MPDEHPTPSQLSRLGPYRLTRRLGGGRTAEVYQAIERGAEGFERVVAVKHILSSVAADPEVVAQLKQLVQTASELQHGNIVQTYNLGKHGDDYYIAREYIAGSDLRTLLDRARPPAPPLPLPRACHVVMKVCEALDYAHNKRDRVGRHLNIVHRDVSPANILVSYEGEVKLIDFGLLAASIPVSNPGNLHGLVRVHVARAGPRHAAGSPQRRVLPRHRAV